MSGICRGNRIAHIAFGKEFAHLQGVFFDFSTLFVSASPSPEKRAIA